jgi:two-component system sensor histidine kinase BaeS
VRVPHAQRDELGTLARNFNLMVATLESNEALRRHFMADISHELRTPLSVLQARWRRWKTASNRSTPAA